MDIPRILDRAERLHGDRTALVQGDLRLTYSQTAARVRALASRLRECGVARGDRVGILGHNTVDFFVAYYAVAACGAVAAPINVRLAPAEVAFVLRDADARVVLVDDALEDRVTALEAEPSPTSHWLRLGEVGSGSAAVATERTSPAECVSPEDLAHLYYTSGTTGTPKGVMLTHRNVCTHALAAIAELGISDTDVWGHFAPLFHLADAWATFAVTWAGGTHVFLPTFDAAAALRTIAEHGVTLTNLVPTMLGRMLHDAAASETDLSSLRLVLSGGSPIAPDLVRRISSVFGCPYVQTYGMTETSPYLTLSLPPPAVRALPAEQQLVHRARTGRPFATVDLEVVDDVGREIPADDATVGEIRVRGDTVSPGYWNRPDETAAAFRGGWLYTGDLAVRDTTGSVNIVDRKKDMILTGGENVYSTEVENRLHEHPAVLEVAVFGEPCDEWGEIVVAAVAFVDGASAPPDDLIAHCRERLAGFKSPRRVHVLPALPRTGSGKLDKRALRAQFAPPRNP